MRSKEKIGPPHLTAGANTPSWSWPWKVAGDDGYTIPIRCCDVIATSGTPSSRAVITPGSRFAEPGPGLPSTAATWPVVLYSPSAMCAAADSCRIGTRRMPCDSSAASSGSISGQGRPNTKRTPSFARQRASTSPPVISAMTPG